VALPTKTVTLKELEFNPDERTVYDAYHKQGRDLILKYMKGGTLLRNYGHVFAVMMRLRQHCCHKELLPVKWKVSFLPILFPLLLHSIS
jgi:SNF2 family DNA or RNA helicase